MLLFRQFLENYYFDDVLIYGFGCEVNALEAVEHALLD